MSIFKLFIQISIAIFAFLLGVSIIYTQTDYSIFAGAILLASSAIIFRELIDGKKEKKRL